MKKQTSFTVVAVVASCFLTAGSLVAANESDQSQSQNQSPQQTQGLAQNQVESPAQSPDMSASQQTQPQTQQQFTGACQEVSASKLIGRSVADSQGQTVCKIKDLVVDPSTGATRYAIVNCDSIVGMGGKNIAVPFTAIQISAQDTLTISASKQELENASATPTGAWAAVDGQAWTKDVHGYYGQPQSMASLYERESPQSALADREQARAEMPQPIQPYGWPKGAELQRMNGQIDTTQFAPLGGQPAAQAATSQGALQDTVNQTIRQNYSEDTAKNIQANVNDGVVTLTGTVNNQSTRDSIENEVKSLSGVQSVNNQLQVRSNQ